MKNVVTLLLLLFLSASGSALAKESLTEADLTALTEQFIAAKNARQQPDSDREDIEHFLSFIADTFVDEHVKFNVTVTDKSTLRSGMVEKLKDKIIFSNIDIVEMMIGSNIVFVKYREHVKGQPAHMDKPFEFKVDNIMSLEYNDDGKITHIRRHHGL